MPTSTEEICEAITNANWSDLWPRLLLFTEKRVARLYWRGCLGGHVPGGNLPSDLIQTAITQMLSGERMWNGDNNLYDFLCGTIKNNTNHLATSYENKKTVLIPWRSEHDASDGLCNIEDTTPGPSDISERVRKRRLIARSLDVLKDDPLVYDIACYILYYDIDEPSQLAERLRATVPDINNAKKRLRRRISELVRAMNKGDDVGMLKGGDDDAA